jgi:hypothetical protein
MNFFRGIKQNRKLVLTIFFIITLLVNTNLRINHNNQNNLKNDKNSAVFDIQFQSRSNPRKSTYYEDTAGAALDVFVSGNYAYIADYGSGLAIIDISDPTNPGTPVYETSADKSRGVYISGNYAYIANEASGLAIIDITDPTNPGTAVHEDTTGTALSVYVDGNYAFIADGASGLAIIDVTDPTNPGTPVYEDTTNYAWGVYVEGDYAFVADYESGLAIIDISDPTNPGTPVYEDTAGTAFSVYVEGNYAYVADYSRGLAVVNISDPTNPEAAIYEDTVGGARGVFVEGNTAYVTDEGSGLVVIDISDPTNPDIHAYIDTTGEAQDVYVEGNYAYVADRYSGLAVIKVSEEINPGTPVYEITGGESWGVCVEGNYAFKAAGNGGLAIFDISDPTNPGTPVFVDTASSAENVYVEGNYAYIADYSSGLAIIDISDPTNPGTPVYEDTIGTAYGVYVEGNYAYVADWANGLAVIDISDPTNPGLPVYEDTTGNAQDVYVSGNYAYVAARSSGLAIIDISDPTNPGTPVYENTAGEAFDVYISGDYAYVADWEESGLAVIDISDPTNPGTPVYEPTDHANGVFVSGDYAYIADWTSGLAVIDISDPTNPGTPVIMDTAGYVQDVYVSGNYVYLADSTNGLAVIQVRQRVDMANPVITDTPSDFVVATDYTSQSISWTASDLNPGNYTIDLQGTGIVVGPTSWISGMAITYDIPDGFAIGDYIYTVNFKDEEDNSITESVTFAVGDIVDPILTNTPSDVTVAADYTGQTISWTATDLNPGTYTIELQGTGIVSGPTAWITGVPITYDIPDGLALGSFIYTVNFTDDGGNSITESVTFTVGDTVDPTVTNAPSDITVESDYTEQTISWTATDLNPSTYTIELQGTGVVAGPTSWTSGVAITYNIPDGFAIGSYVYTVNFTDDGGSSVTESVTFTVGDTVDPILTSTPSNISVEIDYTGQSISWTATDLNPDTYTIELQGTGIVVGSTSWTSGVVITYNIPDGFAIGDYIYIITFTDTSGNSIFESVTFTVGDTNNPIITDAPSDITVETGYTGQSVSWTATDLNPSTYTIERDGTEVVGSTVWTSGVAIIYNIPNGFSLGSYVYTVTFTDTFGNLITESVTFTVGDTVDPIITDSPSDITVETGYTSQSISWTATDLHPSTYSIELQGTEVVSSTFWTSGEVIYFDIPNGFAIGVYIYTITFNDTSGNFVSDSVTFTVEASEDPTTSTPSDGDGSNLTFIQILGALAAAVIPIGGFIYLKSFSWRNRKIIDMYMNDISIDEIASETGKSKRQIEVILRKTGKLD